MGAVATTIPQAFTERMKRLMGLKFAPASLVTHWEALGVVNDDELDAAIARAARECDEFPSPKALMVFVDEFRGQVQVPEEDSSRAEDIEPQTIAIPEAGVEIPVTRLWRYYCDECSDTGVRSFWCGESPSKRYPWLTVHVCGRRRPRGSAHDEHEWVEPCPCAATNPDVQRKKLRAQQVTRKQAER